MDFRFSDILQTQRPVVYSALDPAVLLHIFDATNASPDDVYRYLYSGTCPRRFLAPPAAPRASPELPLDMLRAWMTVPGELRKRMYAIGDRRSARAKLPRRHSQRTRKRRETCTPHDQGAPGRKERPRKRLRIDFDKQTPVPRSPVPFTGELEPLYDNPSPPLGPSCVPLMHDEVAIGPDLPPLDTLDTTNWHNWLLEQ
jgi:hypothetical protein